MIAAPALVALAALLAAPGEAPPVPGPSPLGAVLALHSDFGLEPLVRLETTEGRRVGLALNDGFSLLAGVRFLSWGGGRFATRVAGGAKVQLVRVANGRALFTAIPLELGEVLQAGPVRLGAGASLLLGPRVQGRGILGGLDLQFGPAPGGFLDAEWIVSARARTGIGARLAWSRYAASGRSWSAPSVGLVLRSDFDVGR